MKEQPNIGDTVHVSPTAQSRFAGRNGLVLKVRTRKDGYWSAAKLLIGKYPMWFNKGEIDCIVKRRDRPFAVDLQSDWVRVYRGKTRRRTNTTLYLTIGRALIARWQTAIGEEITRVDVAMDGDTLTIVPNSTGAYALSNRPGRGVSVHCDSLREVIPLASGMYYVEIVDSTLRVTVPKPPRPSSLKPSRPVTPRPYPPGISRIDNPRKRTHGWFARVYRNNQEIRKFFSDRKWGGRDVALAQAQKWRDSTQRFPFRQPSAGPQEQE